MRPALLGVVLLAAATARAEGLRVSVTPAQVTVGSESGAEVVVTTEDGRPVANATVRATVGQVVGGKWSPGERRSPALVLIAAEALGPDGTLEYGAAVLELIGRGNLPTTTDPGAEVVVTIGGRRYGPVTADASGDAPVDVEVRTVETEAEVEATTPTGRRTVTTIALPAVSYPRGLAFLPRALVTGERGTVTVFLPSGAGEPRIVVVTASGPVSLDSPAWKAAAGEIRRWEAPMVAGAPGEVLIEVPHTVEGLLDRGAIAVSAAPSRDPHQLGVHAGALVGSGARATAGLDWRWRWLQAGVDVAFGDVTHVSVTAGARVRVFTRRSFGLDAGAGLGAAWVDGEARSALSPFVYLGVGLSRTMGRGELGLDLRYGDLRVDGFRVGEAGNLAGLGVTFFGYRLSL